MTWKRLGAQWPMIFTVGVVVWFVIQGLGVSERIPFTGNAANGEDRQVGVPAADTTATTLDTSAVRTAGAFQISVKAFRVEIDAESAGSLEADMTLEIRNTNTGNLDFKPGMLTLERVDNGVTASPNDLSSSSMTISPRLAQLVPVSFSVPARSGGTYELSYAGRTIFSGKPL